MINSMTGFGRGRQAWGAGEIVVEIKSLNHKYFDFSVQSPCDYDFLQPRMKDFVQSKVHRGKIFMSVSMSGCDAECIEVRLNQPLVRGYVQALKSAADEFLLEDDLSLSTISQFPNLFLISRDFKDENAVWEQIRPAIEQAIDQLVESRKREGAKLEQDLTDKLNQIDVVIQEIQARFPAIEQSYQQKLYSKLRKILGQASIDDSRILTEAAILADKISVEEEIVRLQSHASEFRTLLAQNLPIGRHCEFLAQECNREANTIASKVNDLQVSQKVILLKTLIEQIRQQIQNIE